METGTGKTYVYLRTIFELSRRYGFQKFIIVVPSVAIREGVLKNIEITAEHFRALYNNLPFEHFVYDAKKVNRLRQFATSNTLQILVINIDAFRKNFTGTEDEQKSNVIYKESDKLSGRQPIEFVQAARPIVIIDEPQSVDSTEKAQEAIKALNPLCTLALLRHAPQSVQPGLPARSGAGLRAAGWSSRSWWPVPPPRAAPTTPSSASSRSTTRRASRPSCAFTCRRPRRARRRSRSRSRRAPTCSRSRTSGPATADGFAVAEINAEPGSEFIRFNNGRTLRLGEEIGGMREDVWRAQIKHTVKKHLEKELQLRGPRHQGA